MARKPTVRPSIPYSHALFDRICERLADGESLNSISKSEGFPPQSTIYKWVNEDRFGCREKYAQARDFQARKLSDEIMEIADDSSNDFVERENARTGKKEIVLDREAIDRAKLRVDARKWYLSKVLPKEFGDRLDLNHSGKVETVHTGASLLLARARMNLLKGSNGSQEPAPAVVQILTGPESSGN